MPQQSPIDAREPLVLLHLARSTLTAQSLMLVLAQQLFDVTFANCRRGGEIGKGDLVAEDVREGRVSVRSLEWRTAVEHLVHENAERPPAAIRSSRH